MSRASTDRSKNVDSESAEKSNRFSMYMSSDKTKKKKQPAPSRRNTPVHRTKPARTAQTISVDACTRKTVCLYNLKGQCAYGEKCDSVHCKLPYQWLYRQRFDSEWSFVDDKQNMVMEQSFCDANTESYTLNLDTLGIEVDFNSMSATDESNDRYETHRLSTPSSATTRQTLSTKWIWFWETPYRDKWMEYGVTYRDGSEESTADIQSSEIEHAYVANPYGSVEFETSRFNYIMDFRDMAQQNTEVGTKRCVRRRPIFISQDKFQKMKSPGWKDPSHSSSETVVDIPETWKIGKKECFLDHYKLVELSKTDNRDEYQTIEDFFSETIEMEVNVTSIRRIQNGELWENYVNKRTRMSRKRSPNEMQLFHGTMSEHVEAISKQGFDFRLSGMSSGTAYGMGSYFANTSSYSNDYTSFDDHQMFVVKVLVGECAYGRPDYSRPPPKEPDNTLSELYDSCVDDTDFLSDQIEQSPVLAISSRAR